MGKTIPYHEPEPTEFEQCPFCDKLFDNTPFKRRPVGGDYPIDEHIKRVHNKVRVRKGSNYKWIDRNEALKRRASEPSA